MPIPLAAAEVLDREFLAVRARLIDIAAALDRIARAEGPVTEDPVTEDPRLDKIRQSLEVLAQDESDRAERLQMIFSLPYRDGWQKEYSL